jgi:osmoprotectant transport system substrate-binding protein
MKSKKYYDKKILLSSFIVFITSLLPTKTKNIYTSYNQKSIITVGAKNFTENLILAEIYSLALEDHGFQVNRVFDLNSFTIHSSIVNNHIDLYPEYTSTALRKILELPLEKNLHKVYDIVKEEYKKRFDIIWLNHSKATIRTGLVVPTYISQKYSITTISELHAYAHILRFASRGQSDNNKDDTLEAERVYGKFNWKSKKVYDSSIKYQLLGNRDVDVALANSTEGHLRDDFFTLLKDDKHAWTPYNSAPVVRKNVLNENPNIATILNTVSDKLDTNAMLILNSKVDLEYKDYRKVAKGFYEYIKKVV